MGSSSKTSETTQDSTTAPWQPTHNALNGILSGIQSRLGSWQTTDEESKALNAIKQNAYNMPDYGAAGTKLTNDLLAGGPDRTGYVTNAYNDYKNQLSPYLASDFVDPTSNPQIQKMMELVKSDIGGSINSQFAGAGRDLSGLNQQAYGRGVSQGTAGLLLDQYNKNMGVQRGAQDSLFGAGGATAGALSSLDQTKLGNQMMGANFATSMLPQIQNLKHNLILDTTNRERNLPLQNLGILEGLTVPIAGLGSQGHMTGTTTETSKGNPWQTAIGGGLGLAGLFGGMGGFGGMFGGGAPGMGGFGVGSSARNNFGGMFAPWYNR